MLTNHASRRTAAHRRVGFCVAALLSGALFLAPAASAEPNPWRGIVLDDVDVYDVPGGEGTITGMLRKGTYVFPRTPCPAADWCELTTSPPGQTTGWVWGEFLRNEPNR